MKEEHNDDNNNDSSEGKEKEEDSRKVIEVKTNYSKSTFKNTAADVIIEKTDTKIGNTSANLNLHTISTSHK